VVGKGLGRAIECMSDPPQSGLPHGLIAPMLATPADAPPQGAGWAYEIKWDGVRALAYFERGNVHAFSRRDNELTESFPEFQEVAGALGESAAVLDGELVARAGVGFSGIQQRLHLTDRSQIAHRARAVPVTYIVFDLLHLDGRSLLDLPYDERRSALASLPLFGQPPQEGAAARIAESFCDAKGEDVLAAVQGAGLEGIVAKQRRSPYRPGRRTGEWLKIKVGRMQEAVIGGWTEGQGGRSGDLGALLLGIPDDGGRLVYAGKVGTGFSEAVRRDLLARLAPLATPESPFSARLEPREAVGAHFVQPVLVGEVRYGEWTPDGRLRHPTWRGLREDKSPGDVSRGR
jgi:bifunctional non-homologous end joining protein LigD